MTRPIVEAPVSAPPKRVSPTMPIAAQVVKYPSARAAALGRGLRELKNRIVRRSKGGAIEPPMARTMSPGSRSLIDILLAAVLATPVSLSRACAQGRGERATIALGFLCQGRHLLLGSDNCNREAPDRHGWYPFAMGLIYPPWSGQPADRSKVISLPTPYYVAKASRSCFSCSSGRLVEMISKSYCLSSSMILSGAVAPLVKANSAEDPSVTFSLICFMKSSLIPTSAIDPVSAPIPAPIAAPRKGTKKISPNRKPQKAPPSAPAPPVLCS